MFRPCNFFRTPLLLFFLFLHLLILLLITLECSSGTVMMMLASKQSTWPGRNSRCSRGSGEWQEKQGRRRKCVDEGWADALPAPLLCIWRSTYRFKSVVYGQQCAVRNYQNRECSRKWSFLIGINWKGGRISWLREEWSGQVWRNSSTWNGPKEGNPFLRPYYNRLN